MREKNLTFDQVATSAGVSVRTVYNAADGRKANRSTKKLIAHALRKPETYVFPVITQNHCSNNSNHVEASV